MMVTDKGQVTIPKTLRDALGIQPGTEVSFEAQGETLIVRKLAPPKGRGRLIVERLQGRGDVAMTTDELMALTRGG